MDKLLEDLSPATVLSGNELFYAVQDGVDVKATASQVWAFGSIVLGTNFQPKDDDLTALSNLNGTDTIYYRSGSSAWSPVSVGSGLAFTGGTLVSTVPAPAPTGAEYITASAHAELTAERVLTNSTTVSWDLSVPGQAKAITTAGGGNVSSDPLPSVAVAGQIPRWTTPTTIQGSPTIFENPIGQVGISAPTFNGASKLQVGINPTALPGPAGTYGASYAGVVNSVGVGSSPVAVMGFASGDTPGSSPIGLYGVTQVSLSGSSTWGLGADAFGYPAIGVTVNRVVGGWVQAGNKGLGTVGELTGLEVLSINGQTGVVTTATGINLLNQNVAAIAGTVYGLKIADQTPGSIDTYAIKTGTGKVSFGDNVGVGTVPNPSVRLHVKVAPDYNFWLRAGVNVCDLTTINDAVSAFQPLHINSAPLVLNAGSLGNVGIGITGPLYPLHVKRDQNGGSYILLENMDAGSSAHVSHVGATSAGTFHLAAYGTGAGSFVNFSWTGSGPTTFAANNATGQFIWYTGSPATEKMRLDSAGKLGIGTTVPQAKLVVSSNAATLPAVVSDGIQVGNADGQITRITLDSFGSTSTITMRRANTTAASPSAVVSGDNMGTLSWQGRGATVYSTGTRAAIQGNATENWSDTANGINLAFYTTPNTTVTVTERMRIDQNGNVGIGTTAPSQLLHVRKDLDGDTQIRLENLNGSGTPSVRYYWGTPAGAAEMVEVAGFFNFTHNGAAQIQYIAASATSYHSWLTGASPTEKMALTNAGRLGVGVTNPSYKMVVVGASVTSAGGGGTFAITTGTGASGDETLLFGVHDGDYSFIQAVKPGTGYRQLLLNASAGNVGIGVASATAILHNGTSTRHSHLGSGAVQSDASGNLSVTSDVRLKDIDSDFARSLEELRTIQPILYHWNERSGLDRLNQYVGFSAQQVQASIPEAIGSDGEGFLTLSDRALIATLVNAVKALDARLTAAGF